MKHLQISDTGTHDLPAHTAQKRRRGHIEIVNRRHERPFHSRSHTTRTVGPQGTAGADGSAGPTGSTGPTGATGPAAANAPSQYAYVYNLGAETVALEALFVNGSVVSGTIYGSGAGTQQNTGQAIVTIGAGDLLTVRNHTSSSAVGLATPIGGTQASTNASVAIEQLA